MKWQAFGPGAALVEVGVDAARALAEDAALCDRLAIREVTPAPSRTLLEFDGEVDLAAAVEQVLCALEGMGREGAAARLHEIPVRYGGEDFDEAVAHSGLSPEEWVRRHTAPVYEVEMLGFAPGFAYLGGLDPLLHMPRRSEPRARIPGGSVAIGGRYTGIYSLPTAGGWNLVGRTDHALFQPDAQPEQIFTLRFGDRIRFRSVPVL